MGGADTVAGDDGVVARVVYDGVDKGGVDRVSGLVSGGVKDVGDTTIRADGFELRPVDHAKGLQAADVVLKAE